MSKKETTKEEKKAGTYIYLLRCQDDTIYTGIAKDLTRRMQEHAQGGAKGARYTKSHGFLRLEAAFKTDSWSDGGKLEYAIKQLSREQKEQLIQEPSRLQCFFQGRFQEGYEPVSKEQIQVCNEQVKHR